MPENNKNFEDKSIKDVIYKQVSLWLSIGAIVFGAFIYLTQPATENYTALELQSQRIEQQEQVIDKLTETQQNDTQEIKSELSGLRTEIQTNTNALIKVQTILEERLPAKQ